MPGRRPCLVFPGWPTLDGIPVGLCCERRGANRLLARTIKGIHSYGFALRLVSAGAGLGEIMDSSLVPGGPLEGVGEMKFDLETKEMGMRKE